jgi:3-hydroxyisobutyrate dehydrogenase-like beta-hydroxyacid dehydrogenase
MGAVATRLGEAGLVALDGSISGPPPRLAGTTIVYLSGPRATEVASLGAPGLELRVVGESIGTASAVKMSTASFYKGQTALFAQALRAARANGVLELVLDDINRHYPDFVGDAPRLLQSIAAKSARYVAEMEEIAATRAQAGLTPDLFTAFAAVYLGLSRTAAAERQPEQTDTGANLDDVLAALDETAGR